MAGRIQSERAVAFVGMRTRVWGAQVWTFDLSGIDRFTPTRVGSISRVGWPLRSLIGSPPRVWGASRASWLPGASSRFTPTRVGSIPSPPPSGIRQPVHPHACGEHLPATIPLRLHSGSPPRVWGAYDAGNVVLDFLRFTPTRVGSMVGVADAGAHRSGSPPHVWGACGRRGR